MIETILIIAAILVHRRVDAFLAYLWGRFYYVRRKLFWLPLQKWRQRKDK